MTKLAASRPFEWCGQGLVEIVDIEDDFSLRRGEAGEIHQMTVATGMNNYPAAGVPFRSCACIRAVPRKRRLRHPTVAKRDQILKPVLVRSFDQLDYVTLALPKDDIAM